VKRLALLLGMVLLACDGTPTGPPPPPPGGRPLGSAFLRTGPRPCDGLQCWDVDVTCPGVAGSLTATLHVRPFESPALGTVLFFSGGEGTSRWSKEPPGLQAQLDLAEAGFRVVEVQWNEPWLFGSSVAEGHLALACRPATLTRWVYEQPSLHAGSTGRAFCVTGNSGGAAQVAYGLSHYGMESIVDLALPSEGPPMGRIDLGCDRTDPTNEPFWYKGFSPAGMDMGFGFDGDGPCERSDPSFSSRFRAASVVNESGDYEHPSTRIHFLMGELSGSEAQVHGLAYHARLVEEGETDVALEFLPGVRHTIMATTEGANAIRDVILNECRVP